MSFLKSDLVPMKRDEIDLLENYCTAFGIAGGDWQDSKDWQFDDEKEPKFNEVAVNEIRLQAIKPLLELRDKLCPILTSSEFTKIVFDFLDGLKVIEKVASWVEQAIEAKDYAVVEEHRQFYDRFVSIFDELVEVFDSQQMRCEDYLAIINSAFSQMTLAFIPPGLDQVLVGSIERSRHPDLKAVFVTGATQKQFPVPISYRGILSNDDRIAAESAEFELTATMEQTLSQRQYLAYIAFTRPSQFLYVTYPSADDSGREQVRSQFIANLAGLFEDFKEESIADEQINIEKINSRMELADLLCKQIGKDGAGQLEGLVNDMCSDGQLAEVGRVVQAAMNYENKAKLDDEITGKFFSKEMKSSATKLGTFAACPYKYFAEYMLELKERKEFKLEPLDLGIFYHSVLDCVLKELNNTKKDFATICDEELLAILGEQITKVISDSAFIANFKRHSAHNSFIINCASEVLEDCVLAISQMVRAGQFRPSESEVWFGKASKGIGDYKLAIENGRFLSLSGKIDRIDVAMINGKQAALVFDYKSKAKSFDWSKFRHGLDMQLVIYLLAVHNSKKYGDIAGAFYMPVDGGMEKVSPDELDARKDSFNHKAKGIFNGEYFDGIDSNVSGWSKYYNLFSSEKSGPYGHYLTSGALKPKDFEKVLRLGEENIIRIGGQIGAGKIEITPYKLGDETACSLCKYQSVCRFDWQINDYNPLAAGGKEAVVEVKPEGNNG
jgi:ATP-dependent helicase/nuclease subunit B